MAFRLDKDESVRKGVRRVLRQQLEAAAVELAAPAAADEAVHDARKRIKKSRAVLQLIRSDRRGVRARDRKRLRRSAHLLSQLRDASAVVDTARGVCADDHRRLVARACALVRDRLSTERRRVRSRASHQATLRRAARLLRSVRRSADPRLPHPRATIAAGLGRSYKRARRGLRRARDRRQPSDFHEWRKRLKALMYHLRLIQDRVPRAGQRAARLKAIVDRLGEEHDLQVLREHVMRDDAANEPALARLVALVDRRQERLRREALRAGARLLAETPRQFAHG